jgi:hypothetical protein
MASTRNKNTVGNYELEQNAYLGQFHYKMYENSTQGRPLQPNFAGNGLIMGRMGARDLAKNDCDIESYLFGIGSTNLVKPLPRVIPNIKPIDSLNIISRIPMYVPVALSIEPNQRYLYLN